MRFVAWPRISCRSGRNTPRACTQQDSNPDAEQRLKPPAAESPAISALRAKILSFREQLHAKEAASETAVAHLKQELETHVSHPIEAEKRAQVGSMATDVAHDHNNSTCRQTQTGGLLSCTPRRATRAAEK